MSARGTRLFRSRGLDPPERRPPHRWGGSDLLTTAVDDLTDVIDVRGNLDERRVERLREALEQSLLAGVAFVVVDVRGARNPTPEVAALLRSVARRLRQREGGVAVVGVHPALYAPGDPGDPAPDVFTTRDEALAGVRGRLTPPRSLSRVRRRTPGT